MSGRNMVTDLRAPLIALLAPVVQALVLDPAAAPTTKHMQALDSVLAAYDELVVALSRSSSPAYAHRDLPADEQARHAEVKHQLGILHRLHDAPTGRLA